jgi:hypothetical protein
MQANAAQSATEVPLKNRCIEVCMASSILKSKKLGYLTHGLSG